MDRREKTIKYGGAPHAVSAEPMHEAFPSEVPYHVVFNGGTLSPPEIEISLKNSPENFAGEFFLYSPFPSMPFAGILPFFFFLWELWELWEAQNIPSRSATLRMEYQGAFSHRFFTVSSIPDAVHRTVGRVEVRIMEIYCTVLSRFRTERSVIHSSSIPAMAWV